MKYLLDTDICINLFRGEELALREGKNAAIAHNCILVSENFKHLDSIEGLRVENWAEQ